MRAHVRLQVRRLCVDLVASVVRAAVRAPRLRPVRLASCSTKRKQKYIDKCGFVLSNSLVFFFFYFFIQYYNNFVFEHLSTKHVHSRGFYLPRDMRTPVCFKHATEMLNRS